MKLKDLLLNVKETLPIIRGCFFDVIKTVISDRNPKERPSQFVSPAVKKAETLEFRRVIKKGESQ